MNNLDKQKSDNVINPRELRNAFGSFMTGVTVVTAVADDGTPVGFTANSFTSVSLDPPMLLVCPAKSLSSYDVLQKCKHFAINILSEEQKNISNTFASAKGDRFADVEWQNDINGVPVFKNVVSSFSCSMHEFIDAGDHAVMIGKVDAFSTSDAPGLGYVRGSYFSLALERQASEAATGEQIRIGAIVEYQGNVMLQEKEGRCALPSIIAKKGDNPFNAIQQYLRDNAIDAKPGPVYSVFENKKTGEKSVYFRVIAQNKQTPEDYFYLDIPSLENKSFISEGVSSMMQRYALERQNGVYHLYIGDERAGDIHQIKEES